jgi:hypothetical protein
MYTWSGDTTDIGNLIMTINLTGVATKTAYFSLAAAAFIFVAMLLLTSLHP